jgi:beta-glucosidase/6-phospho-beta-glucosidase/beta-galactosidase
VGSHYGRDLLGNEKMIARWKGYVRSVVSRYKGKITYWELHTDPVCIAAEARVPTRSQEPPRHALPP